MARQEESPAVSVVIPCFNLGEYLDEAVGSVLGQTLGDFEIIVVDPGSTDEATRALLVDYRRPKTEVLSTGRKTAGAARNAGTARARGRYICCLDADDLLEPACLEKAAAVMDRDPGVGIVTFWFDVFGETTGRVAPESASLADFLVDNCACTASLFRREAWEKVGGYDEALEGYEDWDFWIGILEQGYRAEIVKESLFRYRDRAGGKHRASDRGERRDAIMRCIIRRHEQSFREHAVEVISGKDRLLGEYRTYWGDAAGEARRLKGSYDEAVRRIGELDRAQRELGELERAQRELGEEMRRQTAELRRALGEREHELRVVYASKAWRIGCALQEARRSARGFLALPFRIACALRGKED
jgi:glycosyltransferase involved in cell wall biosynthesis